MEKYECQICNYIYDPTEGDPDNGIEPGTDFDELQGYWACPFCGSGKEDFEMV